MKTDKTVKKNPGCNTQGEHGGKKTREENKSGVGLLERMKHSSGIKGREGKSSGIEILIEVPLRLLKHLSLFIINR